ncbi:MAG: DUF2800 domain-containing protein [Hydrogenophaga sp.]|nr:DUF2800 domain-containing protein [Hydrogenophaga sp.]
MAAHAKLSPSSAFRWTTCTASPSQEAGKDSPNSLASMQGTAEHQVSAECLESGAQPETYVGRTLLFWRDGDRTGEAWADSLPTWQAVATVYHQIVIDADSAARCRAYVDFVRDLVNSLGATLFVEQRLPIDHITGEAGAKGTSDAVLLAGSELIICDAKFGRGKVNAYDVVKPAVRDADGNEIEPAVLAPNKQLAMYADGARREFEWMGEITSVRMIIVQPALNHVSEYAHSIERHLAFVDTLRQAAEATRSNPVFAPSADNCFFCCGRMDCQSRNATAMALAAGAFDDLDATPAAAVARAPADKQLGTLFSKLPFIRSWLDDIETRVRDTLAAGGEVVSDDGRYELVPGRQGARKWVDETAAEQALSKMRLGDDMYHRKLISPTDAEKLSKADADGKSRLGPRQWNKLAALIARDDGKQKIVLRPAAPTATDSSTDLFS